MRDFSCSISFVQDCFGMLGSHKPLRLRSQLSKHSLLIEQNKTGFPEFKKKKTLEPNYSTSLLSVDFFIEKDRFKSSKASGEVVQQFLAN